MNPARRILLVRPNPWRPRTGASPPLGCLYLASAARQWDPRIQVRLADMHASRLSFRDLTRLYQEFDPHIAGFSALSMEHADLLEAARRCKAHNPRCLTVVGGPHATMFGDALIADPAIDVVVRGEGERTFVELLQSWADGAGLEAVRGLLFRRDGQVVDTPDRPFEPDLDALPYPAWDMLDLDAYTRANNMNGLLAAAPYMSVMTSRACPYHCAYCHRLFGTRFRQRSVENVLGELEALYHRVGIREIHLVDDCFNLNRPRAKQIADEIVARDLRFRIAFPNAVRGDLMDQELILKLKAAGAYIITYAVETASERLQTLMNKNLNLDKVSSAIELTYRHGLIPAGFFMLGIPTETREEMERTIRFACDSLILKAYFFTVVPFPRTDLYELARKAYPEMALAADISSAHSYWSPNPYYARATGIDAAKVQREAYRRFYFDPVRVARIVSRFPKNVHMARGVFYGLQASFGFIQALSNLRSRSVSR